MLVGIVSVIILITLMRWASRSLQVGQWRVTGAVIGQLVAMPAFWVGGGAGSWASHAFWLQSVDTGQILESYLGSLAAITALATFYPIIMLIVRAGAEIRQEQQHA